MISSSFTQKAFEGRRYLLKKALTIEIGLLKRKKKSYCVLILRKKSEKWVVGYFEGSHLGDKNDMRQFE